MSSEPHNLSTRPRAWLLWGVVSTVTACLLLFMLTHKSDIPVVLGRYSLTYGVQLLVMLTLTSLFAALTIASRQGRTFDAARFIPKNPAVAWGISVIGLVGLIAYWVFFPGGRSQPGVLLFAVYSTGALFTVWIWALRASHADALFVLPSARVLTVLGLMVVASITLATLGHVPPSLFLDEAWVANWGISMYRLGRPVQTLMADVNPPLTMRAPLFFIAMGAWLTTFGIRLENGRLFWILLLWLCLPFVYKTMQKFYGVGIAGLACVLTAALIPPHIYIRMDATLVFFFLIGFWALIYAFETKRPLWYGLAGLSLALMFEGHQFAIAYHAAFACLFIYDYIQILRREKRWVWYKRFWAFAIGGTLGTGLYLVLHSVIWGFAPIDWIQNVISAYAGEHTLGDVSVPYRIIRVTTYWMLDYLQYHPLETALYCAGLSWAFVRGDICIRRLAMVLVIAQVILFLIFPKRNPFYYVYSLPFTLLFAVGLLADMTGGWHEKRLSLARAAAFVGVVGLLLTQFLITAHSSQNADRMIAVSYELDDALPSHVQRVVAWQGYYFGLSGRQMVSSETMFRALRAGKTLADLPWPTEPPQAILLTPGLDDKANILDYIKVTGLVRVRCYPLDIFAGRADLYLRPEDDPYKGVTNCPA